MVRAYLFRRKAIESDISLRKHILDCDDTLHDRKFSQEFLNFIKEEEKIEEVSGIIELKVEPIDPFSEIIRDPSSVIQPALSQEFDGSDSNDCDDEMIDNENERKYNSNIDLIQILDEDGEVEVELINTDSKQKRKSKLLNENFDHLPPIMSEDGESWICPYCKKVFKRRYRVLEHTRAIHLKLDADGNPKKKAKHTKEDFDHLPPILSEDGEKWICPYCDKVFKRRYRVLEHTRAVHLKIKKNRTVRVRVCSVCSQSFTNDSSYYDHYKRHFPELLHSCQYCGKQYSTKYHCMKHELFHTNTKPYLCDQCDYSCTTSSQLRVSLKINEIINSSE